MPVTVQLSGFTVTAPVIKIILRVYLPGKYVIINRILGNTIYQDLSDTLIARHIFPAKHRIIQ